MAEWHAEPIIDWLFHKGRKLPTAEDLLSALCHEVVGAGLPLARVNVYLNTLHPLYYGMLIAWRPNCAVETHRAVHEERDRHATMNSPVTDVSNGVTKLIRRRLCDSSCPMDYPVLEELRDEGYTDYLATALVFSNGTRNILSLATLRSGGFTDHDLAELEKLLHIFTLLLENYINQSVARNILETYLGPISGGRVLDGQVRRGDGQRIHAVIWFADLRASTTLSERLSNEDFLGLLNDYYEATAGSLLAHGGEVLRFIGDASLGVVPIGKEANRTESDAAAIAVAAARSALGRAETLNSARKKTGRTEFTFGIGLHIGEVMYGNIGTPERLEFTVIGAAANHAARIEGQSKQSGRAVVASGQVARYAPDSWEPLGKHQLRDVSELVEIFALL